MADLNLPCFIQRRDRHGRWYWVCYSGDGEPVARSFGSFVRRADCDNSIMMARGSSLSPVYYIG